MPRSAPDSSRRFDPATDLRIGIAQSAQSGVQLTVHGAVDLRTVAQLRETLNAVISDRAGPVVVDLGPLVFGGAECVTALVQARELLRRQRRQLVVVNPPPFFARVLAACRLQDALQRG